MKSWFMLLQFAQTQILISWGFDILFNVLPSPIMSSPSLKFSKAADLFEISI
jgi:hypothetical protein